MIEDLLPWIFLVMGVGFIAIIYYITKLQREVTRIRLDSNMVAFIKRWTKYTEALFPAFAALMEYLKYESRHAIMHRVHGRMPGMIVKLDKLCRTFEEEYSKFYRQFDWWTQ